MAPDETTAGGGATEAAKAETEAAKAKTAAPTRKGVEDALRLVARRDAKGYKAGAAAGTLKLAPGVRPHAVNDCLRSGFAECVGDKVVVTKPTPSIGGRPFGKGEVLAVVEGGDPKTVLQDVYDGFLGEEKK